MRAFEAAARCGSFAKAARELSITQAAVSQQVKLLEAWFGKVLFERHQNAIELTPAGAELLPTVRAAFDALSEASMALRDGNRQMRVRIAAFPNIATNWLIPRLHRLRQVLPEVDVEIVTAARPLTELFQECDIAVRTFQDAPQFSFEYLFSADMYPVVSPSLLRGRVLRAPEDLLSLPLIHFSQSPDDDWRRWLNAAGVACDGSLKGLRVDSHSLAIAAARHGLGVALARTPFASEAERESPLQVPFELKIPSNESWYLVLPKALRHERIRPVWQWLLDEAGRA